MQVLVGVLSTVAVLSALAFTSNPADAKHKPNCGGKMVEAGYFYGTKTAFEKAGNKSFPNSPQSACRAELAEKAKWKLGSSYSHLEKFSAGCILQQPGSPYGKYWCVCSAEACWKPYAIKVPEDFGFRMSPLPPEKGMRAPSRAPSPGPSFPSSRRR